MFKFYYQILFRKLRKNFYYETKNHNYNVTAVDNEAEQLALKVYKHYFPKFHKFESVTHTVGYIATEIYSIGGHTACLLYQVEALFSIYGKQSLFFTRINTAKRKAVDPLHKLACFCDIDGIHIQTKNFVNDLIAAYNKIISNCPKVLFVFIHSNDIFSACLIGLLKKTTPIKIFFIDHASHNINIAMSLCDYTSATSKNVEATIYYKRKLKQAYRIGMFVGQKKDAYLYSVEEKLQVRNKLGIKEGQLLSISGGTSLKFFDSVSSPHFELIKKLLKREPNLVHLSLIKFNEQQEKIINDLFSDNDELKKRLIIIDPTPDYRLYFQCADVAIDSFPMPSALTQIDLMQMKVATVVKIVPNNPELAFYDFFPLDYPYMFDDVKDMENGILKLLHDQTERYKMIEKLYEYYDVTYNDAIIKQQFVKMIDYLLSK